LFWLCFAQGQGSRSFAGKVSFGAVSGYSKINDIFRQLKMGALGRS
jgi:hypothetical protein